jgi:hypothetical protein
MLSCCGAADVELAGVLVFVFGLLLFIVLELFVVSETPVAGAMFEPLAVDAAPLG